MTGSTISDGTPAVSTTADLITLAEAKVFPGMGSLPATDEAIVSALITAVSLDFEREWDNYGVQREVTERYSYRAIKAGLWNADTIWLHKFPVVSVTSITDPDGNTIDADDYWIDKDVGCLRILGGWTIPQDSNGFATYWTIVYTAGRVASVSDVPTNIKLACKMWVAMLYRDPTQNVKSKSVGDLAITYKDGSKAGSLPNHIRAMISCWKKQDA